MKVLSGHDFIKSTKDKQSFLLLVSEEELQAVKEILEREELPLKEKRKGERRDGFRGRRGLRGDRRVVPHKLEKGRRTYGDRRSS